MPHHKSAKKRVGTNEKSAWPTSRSSPGSARPQEGPRRETRKDAEPRLATALSVLDRAAQKGVIHRSTASRNKSRLTLFVHKLPA
jgi:small subunit ribosomal protein S20